MRRPQSSSLSYTRSIYWGIQVAEENPKTYQVWDHRRSIVEKLAERDEVPKALAANELKFTECAFQSSDDKNYHAWAHRQWAVQLFSLWESELEFTFCLIEADNRNNSAWNQRLWVLRNMEGNLILYFNLVSNVMILRAFLPRITCDYGFRWRCEAPQRGNGEVKEYAESNTKQCLWLASLAVDHAAGCIDRSFHSRTS